MRGERRAPNKIDKAWRRRTSATATLAGCGARYARPRRSRTRF